MGQESAIRSSLQPHAMDLEDGASTSLTIDSCLNVVPGLFRDSGVSRDAGLTATITSLPALWDVLDTESSPKELKLHSRVNLPNRRSRFENVHTGSRPLHDPQSGLLNRLSLGFDCNGNLDVGAFFEFHFVAVFVGERIFNPKFSISGLAFD
jgi:hypothetical protein